MSNKMSVEILFKRMMCFSAITVFNQLTAPILVYIIKIYLTRINKKIILLYIPSMILKVR